MPTQAKPAGKLSITSAQRRLLNHFGVALLLVCCFVLWLWQGFVVTHNQQRFEQRVTQLAAQQQQALSRYIQSVVQSLNAYAQQQDVMQWLQHGGIGDPAYQLQQKLKQALSDSVYARLFLFGQAQQEKEAGAAMSFVELDMINRLERSEVVYPEAAKQRSNGDWLVHWVVPIYQHGQAALSTAGSAPVRPQGILSVATSIAGFKRALSSFDGTLAQTDIEQHIGSQRILTFISQGRGEEPADYRLTIPMSHWQLIVRPSVELRKQSSAWPFWVLALVVVATLSAGIIAWRLAQTKNRRELATAQLFENKERLSSGGKRNVAEFGDDGLGASNPIYLVDDAAAAKSDDEQQGRDAIEASGVDVEASAPVSVPESLPKLSDTIFRSYDIRGIVGEYLTPETAELIGRAVASEALAQGESALLVGYDARTHSPSLCQHLQQGILSTGCDVIDIGLVPTPLLNFAAVYSEHSSSGIVVTASHNPKTYNGFKIVINERSLVDQDIQAIKQRILSNDLVSAQTPGVLSCAQFAQDYIETVIADIAITSGLRVVVDAANGASSELAPALLDELGCEVFPLYCEFDGEFPHHDPDPSVPDNLRALIDEVSKNKADLGIALDGDGDRLVVVSPAGKIIWPDQLLMLFAKDVVARHPGCDVVYDVKSTRHLNQLIVNYGGRPVMWKTGHSHMKAKLHDANALLAGEFSGHIFFKERWFGFDDGLYAAARLLEIISLRDQTIDEMLAVMPQMVSTPEYKLAINETEKFAFMEQLIAEGDFESGEKILVDGLRIEFPRGWGLIRASNTSPALTLRFEADDQESLLQLKKLFKREITKINNQLLLEF